MKIGIDIRLIGKKRTGDEVVFFNLVKNLAKLDEKNEYSLLTDITEEEILADIENRLEIVGKKNFKVVSLKSSNRFAWNFWTLPMYLKASPVDIYQTQYITPWFVSKKVKIITIIHDISFNFFPKFIKFSDLFFLKILIPLSLARADKIVAVSAFTKEEIIKYYKTNPEKIEVIYNAVSEDFLAGEVSVDECDSVRGIYKLPENFLLYVGTLQPRKNIPHLIEAFSRIKGRLAGTKLVIGGNRSAHNFDLGIDKMIKQYQLESDVIFLGYVPDEHKKALFALAQAFVFPSLYEGFGIPLLEAMSQKVPVLASDMPSLKEIAAMGALFFDTDSLDEFSEKLYTISMDKGVRDKLIQTGLQRVSFFSWENSAKKTLALYEKLFHN